MWPSTYKLTHRPPKPVAPMAYYKIRPAWLLLKLAYSAVTTHVELHCSNHQLDEVGRAFSESHAKKRIQICHFSWFLGRFSEKSWGHVTILWWTLLLDPSATISTVYKSLYGNSATFIFKLRNYWTFIRVCMEILQYLYSNYVLIGHLQEFA